MPMIFDSVPEREKKPIDFCAALNLKSNYWKSEISDIRFEISKGGRLESRIMIHESHIRFCVPCSARADRVAFAAMRPVDRIFVFGGCLFRGHKKAPHEAG